MGQWLVHSAGIREAFPALMLHHRAAWGFVTQKALPAKTKEFSDVQAGG